MSKWGAPTATTHYSEPVKPLNEVKSSEVTSKVIDLADNMISALNSKITALEHKLSVATDKNNSLASTIADLRVELRTSANQASTKDVLTVPYHNTRGSVSSGYAQGGFIDDMITSSYNSPLPYSVASDSSQDSETDDDTVNPMECLIIFLQDNDILDLFAQAVTKAGTSFEELAEAISPAEYIAYGTTTTSNKVADGWTEVDNKWNNVVNNLQLNELEAWYE